MRMLLAAALLVAQPALAIDVPSGQKVALQEVLVDTIGTETWLRFRFVAPEISRGETGKSHEVSLDDMAHLCDAVALPYIAQYALTGDVIVISMSDRETEFGVSDPDATQFFEAYRVRDNACIWEAL